MYKIYKIVDNTNGNVYIGQTIRTLKERIIAHRSLKDCSSIIIMDNNDWYYELIEETDDKSREHYHIQNTPNCINKIKYTFDKKDYYKNNKNKIQLKQKEYRLKNNTKIKQYRIDNTDKNKLYQKEYRKYINSWGGEPKYYNNLLKISMDVFN
jgi:ATP-dependent Lon protease